MAQNDPKSIVLANFKPDMESIIPYIRRLLPWKGAEERFVQMTELAIRRNFDLVTCNRNSLLLSLIWCAQKNLEPGVDDGCWLIPFKQMVTPVPAYKGLIKVAKDTESVLDVQPYPIYEHDDFDYGYGLSPYLTHKPPKFGSDRGKLIGAYVVFTMPDNTKRFHVMDRAGIEKIRDVSPAYRGDKTGSIWVIWEEAMFLKTIIKQGFKYIPVKSALRDLLYDDSQIEAGTKVSLLLHQSDPGLPELEEEGIGVAPVKPPEEPKLDTSKFDKAVKKLKWNAETMARLNKWLADTAAAQSNKLDKAITSDMVKLSCVSTNPATPPYATRFDQFLDTFKQWQDKNYPVAPTVSPGAEGGPAEKAEAEAEAGDEESGPEPSPFEERKEAAWNQVLDKGIPLTALAVVKVTQRADITEENIDEVEELVSTYPAPTGRGKK
jgi:recombination protein RecT